MAQLTLAVTVKRLRCLVEQGERSEVWVLCLDGRMRKREKAGGLPPSQALLDGGQEARAQAVRIVTSFRDRVLTAVDGALIPGPQETPLPALVARHCPLAALDGWHLDPDRHLIHACLALDTRPADRLCSTALVARQKISWKTRIRIGMT